MNPPRRYPYNPPLRVIVPVTLFFGGGAVLMAYKATHSPDGITVNRVVVLGPHGAAMFFWIVGGCCTAFVLLAILLTLRRLLRPCVLELGTEALVLPHGSFQSRITRIPYADIQEITEAQVGSQRFLYVFVAGRKFTIAATLLPDDDSYGEVKNFLRAQAQRHER